MAPTFTDGSRLVARSFASPGTVPLFVGIPFHEILWLWPLGMFAWLVIALAAVDEWRAAAVRSRPRFVAGVACATALIAGLAAVPTRAGIHRPYSWAWPAVPAVEDDVLAAVRGKGPILIDIPTADQSTLIGPALLPVLQREGIPFVVRDDSMARTLGERRRYHPGDARWQLTILGLEEAQPTAGHELVAEWSGASDAQLTEFEQLDDELRSALAARGVPLAPGGAERVLAAGRADLLPVIESARADPDAVLEGDLLPLVSHWIPVAEDGPVIDAERFPIESIPRWTELRELLSASTVRIYLGPVGEPQA